MATNLTRWAGLANLTAALLVAVGEVLHPPISTAAMKTDIWALAHSLVVASLIFGIPGLFGLEARQSRKLGMLGMIGFLLTFVSMTSFLGLTYYEALISPILATEAPAFIEKGTAALMVGPIAAVLPATMLLFSAGWLLFGIAMLRANILPRWAILLAIIGAVPFGVSPLLPDLIGKIAAVVFGAGNVWLGYALWSEQTARAMEPAPAI